MGATYTRQSSYSDGDVITAAHTNDEFNQLLAAFQASTGHTHDGTANEGGPITKMLGTSLTLGDGTAGTDITVTFDGETSDGVLKWMEDEDYFEFSDDILVASTEKLQFRDTAIYINSSTDGQLDIVADTEVQIAATTIDMNGNADVSGTLTYGSLSDGSITITAFVDEDDMSSNSATLVPTQQSVKAYVDTQLTAEDLDFQADSGGALSIDLDSETLTFTGGTGIDTSGSGNAVTFAIDSTVATLADTQTFTNKTLTSPKINENVALTATATELNLLDGVSGLVQADFTKLAAIDSTATELNIVDGNTSIGTTTVSDGHGIVMNHGGTMAQTTVQTLAAYLDDEITAMPNLVTTAATTVGALNSGSITSGFGAIDNGSSAITTTGTITYGSLSDGSITITAFVDEDDMTSNSATLVPTQQSVKAYVDAQITAEDLDVTTDSGTIDIDLDSETLTIAGGTGLSSSASSTTVTMAIDAAQTGITSVVNSSLELGRDADNRIKFGTDNQIIFEVDGGDNVIFKASGEIEATSLDISGDADIDGTLEADAITVGGTALNTVIAGVTVANATTAAVATTVTISDNESTDEDNAIIFTSGGDVDGGNIGLESDGDLTYNPSTGRLTATQLSGTLQTAAQGNVTSLGTLTTLTVDNVIINGSTIGHTGDTDLMTVASGVLTVAGEVDATSLDISGDADIDGTLEADAITVNGTALNTVIANEATALAIALG
jgi:cytoskeletal protein CcmA (bactofilin family)